VAFGARPQDTVGLFTYFAMSEALGKLQAEELALGLPVSDSATGVQTHEMILEANYNVHVYRGWISVLSFSTCSGLTRNRTSPMRQYSGSKAHVKS
jgi:hypothetical protein